MKFPVTLQSVREFFVLSQRIERARARQDAATRFHDGLQQAEQNLEAAKVLRDHGYWSASSMVLEQVRRTLESAETYCESEGVRLPSTKREGEMPLLDRAARDPQIESLEQSIASLEKHIPRLGRELAGEKAVRRERALRITTLVLLGLTLASPLLWRFRPRDEVEHAASGFMADGRSPVSNAFDQNPATAWQLENGQLGWIEARFRSPRALRKVRLLNGINAPWNDRATERYRIELYRGDRIVGTLDGNFAYTATPIVEEKVIPGSTGPVDRVRFVALSFHQAGCGLAEMSWE